MMRNYKKIKAFQLADELTVEIYQSTQNFPKDEIYGLVSQLRRASVSCASNIAEGASRQHRKDYLQFLYIARGSLAEVEYLLHLSLQLSYMSESIFNKLMHKHSECAKTLYGLIAVVEKEI